VDMNEQHTITPNHAVEPMPRTKKAFAFIRVSTTKQIRADAPDGLSLPVQQAMCRNKSKERDAEIVGEYIERASAKSGATNLKVQKQMLADIRLRGDIDYVIIPKIERFSRKRFHEAIIGQELEELGVELVSATESIDNTPSGRFQRGILVVAAEYDNDMRAERTKLALIRKAQLGGTPYRALPGYRNVQQIVGGRRLSAIEVDDHNGPLMTTAFRRYALGDLSLVTLADEMAELGLRNQDGKAISGERLHKLMQSPYYLGKVPFGGVIYDGNHMPLVDRATFDTVQEVMRAHCTAGEKRRTHNHYLKGTIWCGRCGKRLVYNLAVNGQGEQYAYFFCVGRRQGCPQRYVQVDAVERAVERYYATIERTPKEIAERQAAIRSYYEAERATHAKHTAIQRERLNAIERRRDKLFDAYAADAMPLAQLKRKQEELNAEAGGAEAVLEIAATNWAKVEVLATRAVALAKDAQAAYIAAAPLVRRTMNQVFFKKLFVTDDSITAATLTDAYAELLADGLVDEIQQELAAKERTTKNAGPLSRDRRSNETSMARPARFELATSRSGGEYRRKRKRRRNGSSKPDSPPSRNG
jgi:site-specific DNA recombinase